MRVVHGLMLAEAIVNVISGAVYLWAPSVLVLDMLRPELKDGFAGSPEALVWGMFGSLVITQSVLLVAGAFGSYEIAATAYWSLALGEVMMMPLIKAYVDKFGVWNVSSYGFAGAMTVLLVLRLYVLVLRPDLLAPVTVKPHLKKK